MINLPILFQDESIIVVDKPINLAVHKNDFMPHDAAYVTKILGDITNQWVYNVHRLDAKTSGVMVFALTKEVAHDLAIQFEQKKVAKTYIA
ncbi:MAG: pseudouridylate synthase, partial [Draconibacterium sp.]